MMNNEVSTYIVKFVTTGAGDLLPGYGQLYHIVNMHYFFIFSLWVGSDKYKKAVLMICSLIPIVLTGYIAAFLCHR